MKSLVKLELVTAIVAFGAIFVCGLFGRLAVRAGADQKTADMTVRGSILLLFFIFGLSCIGLLVHLFIMLQTRIGNGGSSIISFCVRHETGITFTLWGVIALGTVVALPYILKDMAMSSPAGKSQGVLVADIGMTIDEIKARSSLQFKDPRHMADGSRLGIEEVVFDYRIGDSAVIFPQSRYYWIATPKNDPHVSELNIGISASKMSKPELDQFQRRLQEKLSAEGWVPGHYVATSEETVRLWGGEHTAGDGRYWARGNTLLIFETKRMDDQKQDELPGSGEFILSLALRPRNHDPRLVFESSAWKR